MDLHLKPLGLEQVSCPCHSNSDAHGLFQKLEAADRSLAASSSRPTTDLPEASLIAGAAQVVMLVLYTPVLFGCKL